MIFRLDVFRYPSVAGSGSRVQDRGLKNKKKNWEIDFKKIVFLFLVAGSYSRGLNLTDRFGSPKAICHTDRSLT